ncbi:ATP-dependent protease subunit HslV [Litorimonas sp. RW-G-Af-16]|uniref:ATP-dependent protease subunit HslV n=1 Tax=Litorimonas sp. RW-G-Af-16 TaxID=3241168 RepID=UPI00390C4D89
MNHDYADASQWRGTTILSVRKNGKVIVVGDGQVSAGNTVMKSGARKVRTLAGGKVLTGFAGATADAFALLERLEAKLEQHPTQLARACVELAKDWRTDKYLRQLQAMMIVADAKETFVLTGNGDVVQPDEQETGSGITAIGSGGNFALSAALAMDEYEPDAEALARKAMAIADRICVFTNGNLTLESLKTT